MTDRMSHLLALALALVVLFVSAIVWSVATAEEINSGVRSASGVTDGDPELGQEFIRSYGCGTCHFVPGVPGARGTVGPPLNGFALRDYIAGNVLNTPENLVQWIVNPESIEPGTAMPIIGVSPEDARDIAAYLYTLDSID